jgi:hypothetical protein
MPFALIAPTAHVRLHLRLHDVRRHPSVGGISPEAQDVPNQERTKTIKTSIYCIRLSADV